MTGSLAARPTHDRSSSSLPAEKPDGAIPERALRRRRAECRELERLTGWRWESSELGDFLHHPRKFPPDISRWRQHLVASLQAGTHAHLHVSPGATKQEIRDHLDDLTSYLREVTRILAVIYRTPDLGNKTDPVDELVYIILSRKTREDAYQQAYEALKRRFPSWDELLEAPEAEVEQLVWASGLSGRKTRTLFAALGALRQKFGSCNMEPAREWTDEQLEDFLRSLPEIERKSAYCVMMYAFGRKVFPVDTHVGRVLSRLEPFRSLGLQLHGLDHKRLQKILADLVPPDLRHALHVNLVMHGRAICKGPRPSCASCELARFCHHRRAQIASATTDSDGPTFVDLFCGAGGLSTGFVKEGFRPLLALDSDPSACRTYRLNHPELPEENVICRDIRTTPVEELERRSGPGGPDVLIGAPPCQGFSIAGMRSKLSYHARATLGGYSLQEDERNFLFQYMVGAALRLRPQLFLMENVPGMNSARKGQRSFMRAAEQMLRDAGYTTAIWKLDAAAYGVPQRRVRNFLVASSGGRLPARPEADYQDRSSPSFDIDALPPITLEAAIFDLPPVDADCGPMVAMASQHDSARDRRSRFYLRNPRFRISGETSLLFNHRCRYHNDRDLELYGLLTPGEDSIHAIERHGRADLMRYRRDVFDDKYARLRPDQPGKTIVSHLAKDGNSYIHPFQVRSLTPREAARIQSFSDGFVFTGSRSDQWIQLGNAVPPVLAAEIARSFLRLLRR